MASSVMVFPEMPELVEVSHRVGDPATFVTVPVLLMLANWPEAVPVRVVVPGALLRVKLKSLSAWAEVVKEFAGKVLFRTTITCPALVVTVADADRLPEFAAKGMLRALAGSGPEARARSAMTKLRRVKLSFMRCFSLRDLYVFAFGTRPAGRRRISEKRCITK